MDALDEFFRGWCEPEAWCERCRVYPAIHVVVQDDDEAYGSIVTYARIWDAEAQSHIAVCRECSKQYIDSLDQADFHYAPRQHQASGWSHRQVCNWRLVWSHIRRWKKRLCNTLASHLRAYDQASVYEPESHSGSNT